MDNDRGKRKTALRFEALSVILLTLAVLNVEGAKDVFSAAFGLCLGYAAALRGLDAKWPSRM
jgi:phosphatidylglycerophosphate synthase